MNVPPAPNAPRTPSDDPPVPERPLPENGVLPESAAAWRAWLDANHATAPHAWLVTYKKGRGPATLTYDEAVTEALAVGWVDSRPGKLDEARTMLYFSPRKAGSGWARPNKVRISRLEAEGRMGAAGRAKIEAAKADGSWTKLDDVEDGVVPPDLGAALDALPGARAHWDAFPRSARRGILEWIAQAKTPPTRARRIADTAGKAVRGQRANQWTPKR